MRDEPRWRDLLSMAVDLAFETDTWGRLVFLTPDDVLGWPAGSLIGKPAELLLAAPGRLAGFNPFRAAMMVHNRRAWLNRAGGGYACLRFTCAPLLDTAGLQIGTRGVATLEATDEAPMAYAPDDAPGEPRTGRRTDDPAADPLADAPTGLMSRQTFLRALSRSLERLDWDALPGTLMHAGIEGVAELNATLGPAQGDAVMAAVGRLLSHSLRTEDLVARLDSATFAMWMAGADHMTAAERAEMLQSTLPRMVAALVGPDAPKVGVAIGIAPRHHGGETVDMLMRRAERALSAVREGGTGWLVAHVTEP